MEGRNEKLREGLGKLYTSQVLAAVATVLMIIPVINIVALILAIVGAVMALMAMLKLNNLHSDYKMAVNLLAINVALAVIKVIVEGSLATVIDLISSVVSFAQTYYIIRGTNSLLNEIGRDEVAEKGNKALKLYMILVVAGVVVSVMTSLLSDFGLGLALVLLIATLVVSIAAMVYYIKYLGEAKDCF